MGREDQEMLKYMCKLCDKSFPCGRSLGGHMRSHVINSAEHGHQPKLHKKKKKLSTLINNGGSEANTKDSNFIDKDSYGLRENPKKTCKFKDSSHEDTLLHDKVCKECGKGFLSWKALFGHMKCHSDKVSTNKSSVTLERDSWTIANQKVGLDGQSDNENLGRNRKKRSSRMGGMKRYMSADVNTNTNNTNTTSSSSISISINANINSNNNNIDSTSVSGIEQEQEEIAMCLMMLSRDVSQWGRLNSDSDSAFLEADLVKFSSKTDGKNSVCNVAEVVKIKKLMNGELKSNVLAFEDLKTNKIGACDVARNGSKKVGEFLGNLKVKKKNMIKESETDHQDGKFSSRKRKGTLNLLDPELGFNIKDYDPKESKFECTTCNKAFHSYQALGGHKASHKKLKGCFDSRFEAIGFSERMDEKSFFGEKKIGNKGGGRHECPICFRKFSSGQALGGHKRSHMIAEVKLGQSTITTTTTTTTTTTISIVIEEPVLEIRDLFDLNMPAPVEEDISISNSSSSGIDQLKPWWVESNHHKHESFLTLLSS